MKIIILLYVFIQEDYFNISDGIPGSPTSYTAHMHVSNVTSSTSFNSPGLSSCEEGSGCPVEIPKSFYCTQSTIITVTISAANTLGSGPRSNPFMIGIHYCNTVIDINM
jgi:hypothetical protein